MTVIGKIKEINGENYPELRSLVGKPLKEKSRVLQYMKKAPVISAAAAAMRDALTGEFTGWELLVHSDGKYLWRSDVTYYVEKYDMELPGEFVQHILEGGTLHHV